MNSDLDPVQVPLLPTARLQHGSLLATTSQDRQGVMIVSRKLPEGSSHPHPHTKAMLMLPEVLLLRIEAQLAALACLVPDCNLYGV